MQPTNGRGGNRDGGLFFRISIIGLDIGAMGCGTQDSQLNLFKNLTSNMVDTYLIETDSLKQYGCP